MQKSFDNENDMRLPRFHLGQDLSTYLSQIRKVVFSNTEHSDLTVVLGNPSCDLDSFICALTLSYFYNARPNVTKHHRNPIYVPVLNLPNVEKSDLWRLRPEFGAAIKGAFGELGLRTSRGTEDVKDENGRREQDLLEQLITIHELANNQDTLPTLKHAFSPSDTISIKQTGDKVDVILVDHNAPAFETINATDVTSRFNLVGCIDHHVEENVVPQKVEPRIIRLGIGSCMSLVGQHLRDINLWTAHEDQRNLPGIIQISRLALTPILIDTWNLKAPGNRVSDIDRDQVAFIEPQTGKDFNRKDLFRQIQNAKSESLNLLRMHEIFARDYKSYTEDTDNLQDREPLNIGIGSLVRDLKWLAEHAKGKEALVNEINKYARHGEKMLEIFGLLTRSGDRKEVCIFSFGDRGREAIKIFEKNAGELKLETWSGDDELSSLLDKKLGKQSWKVWWMVDTSKSRKQVAPLIRNALKGTSHTQREISSRGKTE